METFYTRWRCLLLSALFAVGVNAFPKHLLYDDDIGQVLPRSDDISSPEIRLKVPIVFYGQTYTSIFVNSNGLLSFQTEIPTFFNIEFPLDYPVIAPLYSNVDNTQGGDITYYETDNPTLLSRATTNVHDSFSYARDFQARSLFIVTWGSVGYHKGGTDKRNTFQVAIASDGSDSFVEFLFPEGGIQWIQGTGDESGLPDARAQSGFVSADGRYFLLQGSGTDLVKNLEKWSNMKLPGQWIFRVGRIAPDKIVEEPDVFKEGRESIEPKTCATGATFCHSFALCEDIGDGFCCNCKELYYGNGRFCVKKDVPLRVNGKVSGKINEEIFAGLDLQSYIVMSDGRSYTAISKIPESVGYDIQTLQLLGSVIGWLFAKPISPDSLNGYQLTGGTFNHSATIEFLGTGKKVTFRHRYLGLDVFDQLRLEVDIQGELPHIPVDAKISMPDYEEQFTLNAPGVILSSSKRTLVYSIDGTETPVSLSIDQSFAFDYCKFKPGPVGTTWRLKSTKNFISYEAREQIVRFGISNKVGPLGSFDPCVEGRSRCGANSACVVENDSYRCACSPGFQRIHKDNEASCQDINECQSGLHYCDYNAQCINEIGSYACRCNPGFEGDGRFCQNAQSCASVQCPENSQCVEDGLARCECLPGFVGRGSGCVPVTSQSCRNENNCSPYGACTINPSTNHYYCVCLPGYTGDGYTCQELEVTTTYAAPEASTAATPPGHIPQQCLFGNCWCPDKYKVWEGTQYCIPDDSSVTEYPSTPVEDVTTDANTCNVRNNCDRNAQCIYDSTAGRYVCTCNFGYEGDGYRCNELDTVCVQSDECDVHATCVYNATSTRAICVCEQGYLGNGKTCHLATCSSHSDCLPNEDCMYSPLSQEYECACKENYTRDSQQQCVFLSGTCGGGRCTEHAECLYDDEYQTYYCTCKSDYVGDGITECKPRPVGCNVVNNCGLHADCVYDPPSASYNCKCTEGFYGDGTACFPERNCHVDPYICHPRAVCVSNVQRKFVCECQPGFVGNGTYCKESPRHDGNFLILNQGNAVFRVPFDAPRRDQIKPIHLSDQMAIGLDIDCYEGRVYWSDIANRKIKSAAYNGSNATDFISQNVGSPEGLAVDWVSRNIYWTDSAKDTIEVANLDTKLRVTLLNTSLVNPRGIAVHPQRGKIFWTDWNRVSPKIEWANMDGTGRQTFLIGDAVKLPNSLVIDFDTEQLCYADAGTKKIECVDIESKYQQTIAVNCTYPFGITVTDRHIYWSDWISKKIELVDKRTLNRLPPIDIPAAGSGKMYGLVAVPERCAGLINICQYSRDQCPRNHICLPNGSGSRSCLCGYKDDYPHGLVTFGKAIILDESCVRT